MVEQLTEFRRTLPFRPARRDVLSEIKETKIQETRLKLVTQASAVRAGYLSAESWQDRHKKKYSEQSPRKERVIKIDFRLEDSRNTEAMFAKRLWVFPTWLSGDSVHALALALSTRLLLDSVPSLDPRVDEYLLRSTSVTTPLVCFRSEINSNLRSRQL